MTKTIGMRSPDALAAAARPLLVGADTIVSTMGIGSGIGSLAQFRAVEVDLPSSFARAARSAGVRRAVLLTAAGANVHGQYRWLLPHVARGRYFHLKGLVEQGFAAVGFPEGVAVFRPGGLLGSDHLPGWLDGLLARIDRFWPARFQCIHVEQLA